MGVKIINWDGATYSEKIINTYYKVDSVDYTTLLKRDTLVGQNCTVHFDTRGIENNAVDTVITPAQSEDLTNMIIFMASGQFDDETYMVGGVFAFDNASMTIGSSQVSFSKGLWLTKVSDYDNAYLQYLTIDTNEEEGTMAYSIAVKPKYVTRKAIDEALVKEEDFLDIVSITDATQIKTLFDTANLAIYYNKTYYPITPDTVDAQLALVAAGSAPTVTEDAYFGYAKLEHFINVASTPAGIANFQHDIKVYNGIIKGEIFEVLDYTKVGISAVNANGYWFAYNAEVTNAAAGPAVKYTNIKVTTLKAATDAGTTVTNGVNYLYLGATMDKWYGNTIIFKASAEYKASATAAAVTGTVSVPLEFLATLKQRVSENNAKSGLDPFAPKTRYTISYVNMKYGFEYADTVKEYYTEDDLPFKPTKVTRSGDDTFNQRLYTSDGKDVTELIEGFSGNITIDPTKSFSKLGIAYNLDGGTWTEAQEAAFKKCFTKGETYTPSTTENIPTKTGYTFSAWSPVSITAATDTNVEFTATWAAATNDDGEEEDDE